MQDLNKIETCIISLQEAINHWLLLQPNVFKRIQLAQLKIYPKKTNTLLFDEYPRTVAKCINFVFLSTF